MKMLPEYVLTFHYPDGRIYNYSTYSTLAKAKDALKSWSKSAAPKGTKFYIVKYTYLKGGMVRHRPLLGAVVK